MPKACKNKEKEKREEEYLYQFSYNRLRSIVDDASFVMTISDLFPRLALVGKNSRQQYK